MMSPVDLESKYQEIMDDLETCNPDGIVTIDLQLLQSLGVLNQMDEEQENPKHPLTHYFHVLETQEKITLFNDQFVVWIVPQLLNDEPATFALVALSGDAGLSLEIIFATTGVYNTSRIVLQVLERYLEEIQENEELLAKLQESPGEL